MFVRFCRNISLFFFKCICYFVLELLFGTCLSGCLAICYSGYVGTFFSGCVETHLLVGISQSLL